MAFACSGAAFKAFILTCLCLQYSANTLIMRYSRGVLKESYNPSAVVCVVEITKVIVCVVAIFIFPSCSSAPNAATTDSMGRMHSIPQLITKMPPILLVPSICYVFQNMLLVMSLAYLQPTVFAVLSQLKILTTAVFSIFILKRRLNYGHWRSLVLLVFATILVDPTMNSAVTGEAKAVSDTVKGLFSVSGLVVLSGFSGVILEHIFKSVPSVTIWERNIQLSTVGTLTTLVVCLLNGSLLDVFSILTFRSWATLAAVAINAIGGLFVALVMRYADNIIKCFAAGAAIALTGVFSVMFMGENASRPFTIGVCEVILSILNYNAEKPPTSPVDLPLPTTQKETNPEAGAPAQAK